MAEKSTLLVWLVSFALLLSLVNVGYGIGVNNKLKAGIDAGISVDELNEALAEIEYPVTNLSGVEERLDSLELEVAEFSDEDLSEEDEAERLVLDELDSRDFKRDIVYAINLFYNETLNSTDRVDRYRHITDIVVKDLDVDYASEEANVTVDLKIYYYIDGYEDEDEKALIKDLVFTVTELEEDEDFEDAEVSYPEVLVINKVY